MNSATQDTTDLDSAFQNYLDIEIISSVVPQATITIYFVQNTNNDFYDVFYAAITNNNVVLCSWISDEYGKPKKYSQMLQTLFAT